MCFKWYTEKRYGITPPEPLVDIGFNELKDILMINFPSAGKYLSDSKYRTTTIDEVKRFLEFNKTDKRIYVNEWFDCDDFAFVLTGDINIPGWEWLPFGIMWTDTDGGGHAVNIFIDDKRDVWIIEPQNDKVFKLPPSWNPYLIII